MGLALAKSVGATQVSKEAIEVVGLLLYQLKKQQLNEPTRVEIAQFCSEAPDMAPSLCSSELGRILLYVASWAVWQARTQKDTETLDKLYSLVQQFRRGDLTTQELIQAIESQALYLSYTDEETGQQVRVRLDPSGEQLIEQRVGQPLPRTEFGSAAQRSQLRRRIAERQRNKSPVAISRTEWTPSSSSAAT